MALSIFVQNPQIHLVKYRGGRLVIASNDIRPMATHCKLEAHGRTKEVRNECFTSLMIVRSMALLMSIATFGSCCWYLWPDEHSRREWLVLAMACELY